MADEPEAKGAEEQPAPPSESDIRAEAMAAAQARTGGEEGAETPPEGTGSESTPEDGDGGETPVEAGEDTPPAEGPPDPFAEMPTDDPEAQKKWLEERDAAQNADFKARMENQKRSILGTQSAENAAGERAKLVEELEALDELALGERLKEDAEAASVWADHVGATPPEVKKAGQDYLINEIVPKLFKGAEQLVEIGGPDLREVMAGDAEEAAAIDELPGGVYTWLVEKSIEAGAKDAVEKYKRSAEYTEALQAAKDEAVRDAFGNAGAPPPRGSDTAPPSINGDRESSNPREAAIMAAAKRTSRSITGGDLADLSSGSGRGRSRARAS